MKGNEGNIFLPETQLTFLVRASIFKLNRIDSIPERTH